MVRNELLCVIFPFGDIKDGLLSQNRFIFDRFKVLFFSSKKAVYHFNKSTSVSVNPIKGLT